MPGRFRLIARHDREALLLYLPLALSLAFVDHRIRRFARHPVTDFIPSVLQGTSGAPAKYRVLMPYTIDYLERHTRIDPYLVFLAVEFVAIVAAILALHVYLRHWYPAPTAVAGVFGAAALIPVMFVNQYALPDTFPDLCLFTLGCLFVAQQRDLALAAVLAIGMLNRETTGFLLVLWGLQRLAAGVTKETIARGAGLALIAFGVYAGVRWMRGYEPYRLLMLRENLEMLKVLPEGFDPYTRIAGYFWLVLFAPAAVLVVRAIKRSGSPVFFRSAFLTASLLLVVAWLFAAIIEVRVLMPIVPLLLPAVVYELSPVTREGTRA
jgi:hypothetical protein